MMKKLIVILALCLLTASVAWGGDSLFPFVSDEPWSGMGTGYITDNGETKQLTFDTVLHLTDPEGDVHLFEPRVVCEELCGGVEMIPWTLEEWEEYRDDYPLIIHSMSLGFNYGETTDCKKTCTFEWVHIGVEGK